MSRRLALALAVLLATGFALAFWLWQRSQRAARPGLADSTKRWSRPSPSGVAALDTDAGTIARDTLTRATQLVPEEPAAWADLGLAHIRLGDLETAARVLEQARTLAPESGAIERLLALLEERRGRFAESIGHLKRAIELDPSDLKSRYALVRELERQGVPRPRRRPSGSWARSSRPIRTTSRPCSIGPAWRRRPEIPRPWPKRSASSASVRPHGRTGSREQLRALEQAAGGTNLRPVITRVIVLRNVLLTVPAFRQDIDALMLPVGTVGEPLRRFLRLAAPSPTPAPPDEVDRVRRRDAGEVVAAEGRCPVPPGGREGRTGHPAGSRRPRSCGRPTARGDRPLPRRPLGDPAVAAGRRGGRLEFRLPARPRPGRRRRRPHPPPEGGRHVRGRHGRDGPGPRSPGRRRLRRLGGGHRAGRRPRFRRRGAGRADDRPPQQRRRHVRGDRRRSPRSPTSATSPGPTWTTTATRTPPSSTTRGRSRSSTTNDPVNSGPAPVPGDLGPRVAIAIADLDGDGAMDLAPARPGGRFIGSRTARTAARGTSPRSPAGGPPRRQGGDASSRRVPPLRRGPGQQRRHRPHRLRRRRRPGSGSAMRRAGSAPWPRRRGSGSSPSPT